MDDPILTDALRAMLVKIARAQKAGVQITPDDQEAWLRRETKGKYGAADAQKVLGSIDSGITPQNLGRSAMQGLTLNWGDEILGKLPSWLGGGASAESEMRLKDQLFRDQHPVADAVAGVVGALPLAAVPLVGGIGETANLANIAKAGMKAGAIYGAIGGAGAGEGAGDRVTRGATGAVAGGALGALLPSLVSIGKTTVGATGRATRKISDAIDRSGGIDAVRTRLNDVTQAGRGDIATLSDLSRPLQGAADFAANNSEPVFDKMSEMLEQRSRGMAGRLKDDVVSLRGGAEPDADSRGVELKMSRDGWANGPNGYGGLRDAAEGQQIPIPAIRAKLDVPKVRQLWGSARLAGDLKPGEPLDQLLQTIIDPNAIEKSVDAPAVGGVKAPRAVTFDDLQQFRRALQSRADQAFNSGNGALGGAYKDLRGEVDKAISGVVPNFGAVNQEYAHRMDLERALTKGIDAWNDSDTRAAMRGIEQLSKPEQDEARLALASQLVNKLRGAMTNRDAAKEFVDASENMQAKIKAAFGDEATFDSFMQRAGWERELNRLKSATGGSQTHRRGAAEGTDPLEIAGHGLMTGAVGLAHSAAKGAIAATTGRVSRSVALKMGNDLLRQGTPEIEAFLQRLAGNPRGYVNPGKLWTAGAPAAFGSLLDQR